MSVEEITKEKIQDLITKNYELRREIRIELAKINEKVTAIGEVTIDNPYDSDSDLIVHGATSGVITLSDGRNEPYDMLVSNMDNATLISILGQIRLANEKRKLIRKGIEKLKDRLEESGLSVEEK